MLQIWSASLLLRDFCWGEKSVSSASRPEDWGAGSAGGGYREQPRACRERRDTGRPPTLADFYGHSRLDCECRLGRTVRKGGVEFSDRLHFIPSSAPFWDAWSLYTLGWLPGHAVLPFPHLQNDRSIISCTSGRLPGIKQVRSAFKLI